MGGRITHVRVGSPPTQLALEPEESELLRASNFKIMRVQARSPAASTLDGDRESQVDHGLEDVILSLSALPSLSELLTPQVVDFSPEEAPVKSIGAFETMPAGLKLEAQALLDYKLAHEIFSGMFLLADANDLLNILWKEMRKTVIESFIQVTHYLNWYIESSIQLTKEAKKH
ncbi:uncharacterized protein [Elaeis guineensis]|uniref:uncharacterized protein n=1 Tax=Elaeis guineensis var. tenera TaxID=51953 RepID=UPI003C6D4EF9